MALSIQPLSAVPDIPAPLVPLYPQFSKTSIPIGSGARRALSGYIRPFSDDATARRVLRAITADKIMTVSGGSLDSEAENLAIHPLEEYLIDMTTPFRVVILEFDGKRHPLAYLIDPPILKRISDNPHLRWDKCLVIEGRTTPALCVYAGNLFTYDPTLDRLTQFINQLATYLAKYIIFLRTRMLHSLVKGAVPRLLRIRKPSEPIDIGKLVISNKYILLGYWAGQAAPSTIGQHLQTIGAKDECWCTSGEPYSVCHRPRELALARRLTQKRYRVTPHIFR